MHATHALKSHCSERMWFREACVQLVEGHHQHLGQVSPTAASDVCLEQADLMQFLPTAAPQGFGLASPWTRQLQGPHSAVSVKDRCVPAALSGFVLPFECPLNLLSHTPNSSHVHSPLQNKRFEMKVQSCSNNHINYLFR